MADPAALLHSVLAAADRISPRLAAAVADPVFRTVRPARPVRERELPVHRQARRFGIDVDGERVVVSEWGFEHTPTAPIVLVVHGWRGRAAQFTDIVRELRGDGFAVVGFDAQGNGDSAGRRIDAARYVRAMQAVQRRYGAFHAVVGHSLGALASMQAIRDGLATARFVSIAGVADFDWTIDDFAAQTGLSDAARRALHERMRRLRLHGVADTGAYLDALDGVRNPLPAGVPTTFVHGDADRVIPFDHAERLHAAHGDRSRLVVVPGAGHTRVLGAPETLDAVQAAVAAPLPAA